MFVSGGKTNIMDDITNYLNEYGVLRCSDLLYSNLKGQQKKEILTQYPISYFEVIIKNSGNALFTCAAQLAEKYNNHKILNAILKNDKNDLMDQLALFVSENFKENGLAYATNKKDMINNIRLRRQNLIDCVDVIEEKRKKELWFINEKKRVAKLTKCFDVRFFDKLKRDFDKIDYSFEYAVIKLVSKLESILKQNQKIDDEKQELESLINTYVIDEEKRSALHKLRRARNNYLHPTKEEHTFTRDDLDNCIEIVFNLEETK